MQNRPTQECSAYRIIVLLHAWCSHMLDAYRSSHEPSIKLSLLSSLVEIDNYTERISFMGFMVATVESTP